MLADLHVAGPLEELNDKAFCSILAELIAVIRPHDRTLHTINSRTSTVYNRPTPRTLSISRTIDISPSTTTSTLPSSLSSTLLPSNFQILRFAQK